MAITIKVDKTGSAGKYVASVRPRHEFQIRALQDAVKITAGNIEHRGRANIRRAGNFGSARWQQGFRAKVSYKGRTTINIRVTHAVPYWSVFETGKRIEGKPLLWIPLSFATEAQGVRARDYPGRLVKVVRKRKRSTPLLINTATGRPTYFGKKSVRIPKLFELRKIARDEFKQIAKRYKANLAKKGGPL